MCLFILGKEEGTERERKKEREKERKRNINVRDKHQLVASHSCLDQGLNLQPRYVPWLEIEPTNF